MSSNRPASAALSVSQNSAPSLTPFWARISKFFVWPLQFGPMVYIGMLSLGMMVVGILPLIGGLVAVAIWFFFFRYAMTVLVQTARGNFNPDTVDLAVESGDRRPVKQSIYLIVSIVLVAAAAGFIGPKFAIMLGLLVTITLPAAIIIIAIHDSLIDALNPLQIMSVISGIGAPYFLLCLFLMLLEGGDIAVFEVLGAVIPDFIEIPVATFFSMYFMLVMYNMMGYVVYQYHEKLGYSVDKTFDKNAAESQAGSKTGPTLSLRDQQIADLVQSGDITAAIDVLKEDMRYNRNDIGDNQKLHKLFLALGDNDKTIAHAQQLISWLLEANQNTAALDIFMRMRGIDPGFNPGSGKADADAMLPLAQAAKMKRNAALAMEFIKGFDKKYPGHRDIPAVYFLAAQLLSEFHRDDKQAIRILQTLLARYPEAGVANEATIYLNVLQQTMVVPS
jgi:hypothetical protein